MQLRQRTGHSSAVISAFACALTLFASPSASSRPPGSSNSSANTTPSGNQAATQQQGGANAQQASSGAFESQMLAYASVDAVARDIVGKICADSGADYVLFDSTSFQTLSAYEAFRLNIADEAAYYVGVIQNHNSGHLSSTDGKPIYAQLSILEKALALGTFDLPDRTVAFGIPTIFTEFSSLVSSLASSTVSNSAQQISISDTSLQLKIAHYFPGDACAGKTGKKLEMPGLLGTSIALDPAGDAGKQVTKVVVAAQTLRALVLKEYPSDQTSIIAGDAVSTQLQQTLATTDASSGPTPYQQILSGAALYALLEKQDTRIVYASVASAGGTMEDTKNFWRSLTVGDKIEYSGGVIVNFALVGNATAKGPTTVLAADVLRYRTDFGRISAPSVSAVGLYAGDNLIQVAPEPATKKTSATKD